MAIQGATMKDYSTMRHIDLKVKKKTGYSMGDVVASIEGNSHGDQIIHFRVYSQIDDRFEGLKTVQTVTNFEGEHWSPSAMKSFIKQLR